MHSKKILILGGSHRDIPLIKAAKELGYFVITLGNRVDYKGHQYADKYFLIDFNDMEKIREIIEKEKVSYLVPGSGEISYLNTVLLSKEFNIGSFDEIEIAKLIHNKWQFKKFCIEHNISVPKGIYYQKNKNLTSLKLPIVVKPTTLSGGRGIEVVQSFDQLYQSLETASRISDEIFLEEYIQGKLIAYSVFLKDQKIVYAFSGVDETYLNPYLITTAYPIKLNPNIEKKLNTNIEKIAKLLKLVDGMFHLQVIVNETIPYIIDVTRRIPGDFYPYLIEKVNGVEYSKAVIKAYIGQKVQNEFVAKYRYFIVRYVVMPSKNGIYQGLEVDDRIKNKIIIKFDLLEPGYRIDNYLSTQVAIFLIKDINDISLIKKSIKVIVE